MEALDEETRTLIIAEPLFAEYHANDVNKNSSFPLQLPLWERFDARLHMGKHLLCYQKVDSTMDVAWNLFENGAGEGTSLIALEQNKGRGRFGRTWVFEQSGSLALSVIVHPPPSILPIISLTMAWAVVNAIADLTKLRATIKWPNDIRIGSKKVAGILTEVRVNTLGKAIAIIGIGMNLASDFSHYKDLHGKATSLNVETGIITKMETAVESILFHFDRAYHVSINNPENPRPWLNIIDTIGERVTIKDGPEEYSGIAQDITTEGKLILRHDDGRELHVSSGEITNDPN